MGRGSENLVGLVAYMRDGGHHVPFAVVSESYDRKAQVVERNNFLHSALIHLEDRRFRSHPGFDVRGVARAAYKNLTSFSIRQGGSTITQQLARSMLNDYRRSPVRKLKELALALKIERSLAKEDILARYFGEVRWGRSNIGIRSAALAYFGKEVRRLSRAEQAALLTLLRGPSYYLRNREAFAKRLNFVQQRLVNAKLMKRGQVEPGMSVVSRVSDRQLGVLGASTAALVSRRVHHGSGVIQTTLVRSIQDLCSRFVQGSAYPTSILVLRGGSVVGLCSTFGSAHCHEFRFNVGSTLKPFVYTYLRRMGFSTDEPVTESIGQVPWPVREASMIRPKASLSAALEYSWNSPFLSCAYASGIESVLTFLASTLGKPRSCLMPSSILGATTDGLTLLELASAYQRFFSPHSMRDPLVSETHEILKRIAKQKLGLPIGAVFIKTGTTNGNRERLVVGGYAEYTFAVLREGNPVEDPTKSGGLISSIAQVVKGLVFEAKGESGYKWI